MSEIKLINDEILMGDSARKRFASYSSGEIALTLRRVPWLARARDMTGNAVANLPFEIVTSDGNVIDRSADWKNAIGFLPNPSSALKLLAGSLCGGAAYMRMLRASGGRVAGLQYFEPSTITPKILPSGLQYFQRTAAGALENIAPSDIFFVWYPDPDVEIGPALDAPLMAAMQAASILLDADNVLRIYARRGFVPPTMLILDGVSNDAAKKAEAFWNRFLSDPFGTFVHAVRGESGKLQPVGAGFEQLRGAYTQVIRQQIENIGAAFGIPAALFMSSAAYATELQGITRAWYASSRFVSIYKTIEDSLNEQIFSALNLRWQFHPEMLDAFRDDDTAKANVFATLSAKLPVGLAARIAGLEMPAGMDYSDLGMPAESAAEPKPDAPISANSNDLSGKIAAEIMAWRRYEQSHSTKIHRPFEARDVPPALAAKIISGLQSGKSLDDVFDAAFSDLPLVVLAEAMNRQAKNG